MTDKPPFSKGLEDVIADESSLGLVNGDVGELYYRGYAIGELVQKKSFDESAYMLLFGSFPNAQQSEAYGARLREHQKLSPAVLRLIESLPEGVHPMEALQSTLAVLGTIRPGQLRVRRVTDADGKKRSVIEPRELLDEDSIGVLAKIPTVIASFRRKQANLEILEPRRDLGYLAKLSIHVHGHRTQ